MGTHHKLALGDIYMQLNEDGRKRLAKIMVIQDVSSRVLAEGVGWKSHTIVLRLLRGETTTVTPDKAVAIALYLGVGVDDLFVPRSSNDGRPTVTPRLSNTTRKVAA